jgi:hypothetical protein
VVMGGCGDGNVMVMGAFFWWWDVIIVCLIWFILWYCIVHVLYDHVLHVLHVWCCMYSNTYFCVNKWRIDSKNNNNRSTTTTTTTTYSYNSIIHTCHNIMYVLWPTSSIIILIVFTRLNWLQRM